MTLPYALDDLEPSAYDSHHVEAVHARPIYLGSGYSEFPCGVPGNHPVMVAAHNDDVTCPECAADVKRRAKHRMPEERDGREVVLEFEEMLAKAGAR